MKADEEIEPGVYKGNACELPLEDESVDLIFTSPPYNVGVTYGDHYDDQIAWADYNELVFASVGEMYRVLKPGGKVLVNIQSAVPTVFDRTPKNADPRHNLLLTWMLPLQGVFEFRDVLTWLQPRGGAGTAWGSWLMPSNPNLRGTKEEILLYYKDHWDRTPPEEYRGVKFDREDLGGDWVDLALNVWELPTARRRDDAPAPFPESLPARAIRLFTYPGDVVLDPFAGSGTTIEAAKKLDRFGIGFDLGATKEL